MTPRMTFHATYLVWAAVWFPRRSPVTADRALYSVSFTPDSAPADLLPYIKVHDAFEATETKPARPAFATARSQLAPLIVPDDITAMRLLRADAEDCRVALDQMLLGVEADLHVAGWTSERFGVDGLALLGIRFKVADLRESFNRIIDFTGD